MLEKLLVLCLICFAQTAARTHINSYTYLAKPAPFCNVLAIGFVYEGRRCFGYTPSNLSLDKPVTVGGPESGFACKDAHAVKNCICK